MENGMKTKTMSGITIMLLLFFLVIAQAHVVAAEKRKIIVGARDQATGTAFKDENGRFTGLEGEALQQIFLLLPQYEFELKFLPQSALFPSLNTRKVDMVQGNLRRSKEREANAIRTRVANNWFPYQLVVPETNTTIHSLKDLEGKRVVQNKNSGQANIWEEYIKENNANIEIVYSPEFVSMLSAGHADAMLMAPLLMDNLNKAHKDFKLKAVTGTIGGPKGSLNNDPNTYFWFRPEDTQLRDDVSAALAKLRADGTLSKISIQFTGIDYISQIDVEAEKNLTR
jgi:L-cystine transport system substrate-binding protein